jgi:hypothetical protein
MQYLPGWTVQCLNPDCPARGQWLRTRGTESEACCNCGTALRSVPPPLAPRFRMRPRALSIYRPLMRPR